MTEDSSDLKHYNPSVRVCDLGRPQSGSCGFHLTRSKWDPYPWVSGVDPGSAAALAGLQPGDCLLEVNGEDLLGQRVCEVAAKVRAKQGLSLLLWNAGSDPNCTPQALCCGPMPSNLQRLSTCMSSILAVLECPVCWDMICPPAHQCGNGHLICLRCRVKTERCPVCRVRFSRGRSLLADQVFNSLTETFQLKAGQVEKLRPSKLRERLFGTRKTTPDIKVTTSPTNKFLTRLMLGKSSSVENLSTTDSVPGPVKFTFPSDLKAKSLSTNELLIPAMSRSPSVTSTHRLGLTPDTTLYLGTQRPASYHGSCEALHRRLTADFEDLSEDGLLYHCPCDADCSNLVKGSAVNQHIQDCHEGPLVQYFKPSITLSLPLQLEETSIISIAWQGNVFYLRVAHEDRASNGLGDTLVWLWLLGDKKEADHFSLSLYLKGHGNRGKELSFVSVALSLSSTSWADIYKSGKGIRLGADTLLENFSTELEAGIPIRMQIQVKEAEVNEDRVTQPTG